MNCMFFDVCGWITPEELQMPPQRKWRDSFSLQCNKPDTHAIAAAYPMPDSMPLEPTIIKFCPNYTDSRWLGPLPLYPVWNIASSGNYEINNWHRTGATNIVDSSLLAWLPWPVPLWLGRAGTVAVVNGEALSSTQFLTACFFNFWRRKKNCSNQKHGQFEIWSHSVLNSAAIRDNFFKPWPQHCVLFVS